MNNEMISNRQAISLMILFIIGESSIFIEGIDAKMDLWLSIIIAIIAALPLFLMFARLQSLFPEKNLLDIMDICFGKYFGKVLILLYSWFAFHMLTILLADVTLFIQLVLLPDTPLVVLIIVFVILSVLGTKYGIEVLGRYSEAFVIVSIIFEIILVLFMAKHMNIGNIQPILYEGMKPVMKGAFLTLMFPLAYVVALTMILTFSETKNAPYKIYVTSLLVGGGIVLIISLSNTLVLGEFHSSALYHPTISAIKTAEIGAFLHRLDILAAAIFLIGTYVAANAFLLGACKGIEKLFGFSDYRVVVIPIALFAINISIYEFDSMMYYFEWSREVWPYYVFPFEIIFPVCIWITAEIKSRKINNS